MSEYFAHAWLWIVGACIGIGQLLSSEASLSSRVIVGRALVSGGLGTAAGLILLAFDAVPSIALFAAAAAIASIGTSALERMLVATADRWGRP